jgi:hypothetical protein
MKLDQQNLKVLLQLIKRHFERHRIINYNAYKYHILEMLHFEKYSYKYNKILHIVTVDPSDLTLEYITVVHYLSFKIYIKYVDMILYL